MANGARDRIVQVLGRNDYNSVWHGNELHVTPRTGSFNDALRIPFAGPDASRVLGVTIGKEFTAPSRAAAEEAIRRIQEDRPWQDAALALVLQTVADARGTTAAQSGAE